MIDMRPEAIERRTAMIAGLKSGEAGNALLDLLELDLASLEQAPHISAEYRLGEIFSMRRIIELLRADYVGPPKETEN